MTVDPEKLQAALTALTDLIGSVLASDASDRFARAAALSTLTAKVQLHGTPLRTKDAKKLMRNQWGNPGYDAPEFVDDQGNGYLEAGDGLVGVGHAGAIRLGGGHGEDFQRQVLMMVAPLLKGQEDTNRSRVAADQAAELRSLIELRDILKGAPEEHQFDERINELTTSLTAKKETTHAVVPTELVRRHSLGVPGEGEDEAHAVRPIPPGEGGDAGTDPGGGEGSGAQRTVAPRDVPPFRSRLDPGADGGATDIDLEGAEGAGQTPEAQPGDGERREVRGREDGGDDGAGAAADRAHHRGRVVIPAPDGETT